MRKLILNNTFGDINSPYFIFSICFTFFGSVDEGSKRITLENYEQIINKYTVDIIIKNGILRERKSLRKWMSQKEYDNYVLMLDLKKYQILVEFLASNDLTNMDKGSTIDNLYTLLEENCDLAIFLKRKGKV